MERSPHECNQYHYKRDPFISSDGRTQWKVSIYEPESKSSPDTKCVGNLILDFPATENFCGLQGTHLWYLTVTAAPAKTLGFCPNLMFLLSHSVRADHRTVLQNQLHLTTREYFISGHSYRWEEAVLLSQGADG